MNCNHPNYSGSMKTGSQSRSIIVDGFKARIPLHVSEPYKRIPYVPDHVARAAHTARKLERCCA